MENTGNPAQRLFDIIIKASLSYNKLRNSGNDTPTSWQVWTDVFEIQTDHGFLLEDQFQLISRIDQSRKLVIEVEELLLKNDKIRHDKYLRPFPKFKGFFPLPLNLTESFPYARITTRDYEVLEFCIDAIEEKHKEKIVDENELKELLSEIQSLYEETLNLKINKNLKIILLDMLKIMENAIHEYRIRGTERLREAIEQIVGIYFVNEEIIKNSTTEEAGKLRKIINRFGSLYSFAADTVQLLGTGEIITKFLGK